MLTPYPLHVQTPTDLARYKTKQNKTSNLPELRGKKKKGLRNAMK